nr:hypothetical protein BHI3_27450 [Bacteriovorax sp. HI3]
MKILLLSITLSIATSLQARELSNSLGKIERRTKISLNRQQILILRSIVVDGHGRFIPKNYPRAYKYIYSQLKSMKIKVDDGTLFWFQKASDINAGAGSSSYMIRTYTTMGLQIADREVPDLQKVSDNIAVNVLRDILLNKAVLPLQNILARDITAAMRVGNIQDLAGWGGSFYYWHMPLVDSRGKLIKDPRTTIPNDYLTVGDSILRSKDQTRRFILTSVLSMSSTPYYVALSDAPGLVKAISAIGELPDEVRLPIIKGISERDSMMGAILEL